MGFEAKCFIVCHFYFPFLLKLSLAAHFFNRLLIAEDVAGGGRSAMVITRSLGVVRRTTRRSIWVGALLAVMVFMSSSAHGWMHSALPLDDLAREAEVIVKVRDSDIEWVSIHPDLPRLSLRASVLSVIKGDNLGEWGDMEIEAYGGADYPSYTFRLPAENYDTAILFLERSKDDSFQVTNDAKGILPVFPGHVAMEASWGVDRRLFAEFRHVAASTRDSLLRARFLAFMARFASESDAAVFEGYRKDSNAWVRLSVHMALARLTLAPEHIQAVVDAVPRDSCALTGVEHFVFRDIFKDVEQVSRCDSHGMKGPMVKLARAYLPIYRALLDNAQEQGWAPPRSSMGASWSVNALRAVGTRQDIVRLYRSVDCAHAPIRHDVLEGIGRILGHPVKRPMITAYPSDGSLPDDIVVWESETRVMLEELMRAEGFL
jgi:hypothetical protein